MKPIELLEKAVCEVRGINPSELHQKTRKRYICETRQMVMYFALLYGHKLKKCSGYYELDHATAIHARNVICDLQQFDRTINNQMDIIRKKLNEQEAGQMIYLSKIDKIAS